MSKKTAINILYPLLFSAQFNVTQFLKIGITISFFELTLITSLIGLILSSYKNGNITEIISSIKIKKHDKIWFYFLILSFLSIIISCLRVFLENLNPDPKMSPVFFLRSLMSLNKFFFYLPIFYLIINFLSAYYENEIINKTYLKSMAFAGILPALSVIIQYSGIGFILLHNNSSYSESFRMEDYLGARPVGLTNEASFFVYQLFFCTLALYYSNLRCLIKNKHYYFLLFLFILAVILSLSRTGLLVYSLFFMLVWFRKTKLLSFKSFVRAIIILPLIIGFIAILARLNVGNLNIGSHFLSAFNYSSDLSTLERYGSSEALFNLFKSKGLLFGVGIYNYQYYIKDFLPAYMSIFHYEPGIAPASFNFIIQLFAELGFIMTVFFFVKSYFTIYKPYIDSFIKDWFLFLIIFSFSFQILNFAVPFLIILYLPANEKYSIYN